LAGASGESTLREHDVWSEDDRASFKMAAIDVVVVAKLLAELNGEFRVLR